MFKLAILGAAAFSFALLTTTDGFAQNNNRVPPGQQMKQSAGPKAGSPGASEYAPGQVKKMPQPQNRSSQPRAR